MTGAADATQEETDLYGESFVLRLRFLPLRDQHDQQQCDDHHRYSLTLNYQLAPAQPLIPISEITVALEAGLTVRDLVSHLAWCSHLPYTTIYRVFQSWWRGWDQARWVRIEPEEIDHACWERPTQEEVVKND